MKNLILIVMLCAVTGCAQKNPFPPDISGPLQPVNSAAIIQELNHVGH